jgi:hypothetical protein
MQLEKLVIHSTSLLYVKTKLMSRVWKQVNAACVDKKEFRLAQICGLNLIVSFPSHANPS